MCKKLTSTSSLYLLTIIDRIFQLRPGAQISLQERQKKASGQTIGKMRTLMQILIKCFEKNLTRVQLLQPRVFLLNERLYETL